MSPVLSTTERPRSRCSSAGGLKGGSSRFFILIGLISVLMAAPTAVVSAQDKVQFNLKIHPREALAGSSVEAVLHARVAEGWHLYSMTQPPGGPLPTAISVEKNPVFEQDGSVRQPPIHKWFDPNFQIDLETFEGDIDFHIPVKIDPSASPGRQTIPVKVRFMVCSDTTCLPPRTKRVTAAISVLPAVSQLGEKALRTKERSLPVSESPQAPPGRPAVVTPGRAPEGSDDSEEGAARGEESRSPVREEEGFGGFLGGSNDGSGPPDISQSGDFPITTLAYLWFAMLFGGLALLTPCVFPMIPITVSYFTKRQTSRKQALKEAALYSLGIVLTFTLIGFSLTFLFGAGGINRLAASPLVNITIALVFILFALNLFGAFEIRVPSSWINALNRKSTGGGTLGILLMALTFSLTSFTCTVPFVGTVMVAALKGSWLWSLMGVAAFASVFSAPFFFLALFPSWLRSLPKSGNWMNSLKITMGFLELAAALKFLSHVDLVYQWEILTRTVFITLWLSIALVTTFYLLGRFHFSHEVPSASLGATRVLFATFFLAVSFYLLRGLLGLPLGELDAFLPPREYGNPASISWTGERLAKMPEEEWLTNYGVALARAKNENRPVFIDFTGYTCTNCRWMESNVFTLPEVKRLFGEYILVRLYTDGRKPEHEENLRFEQTRFDTIALPFYAIMSPQDQIVVTLAGLTRDRKEFIDFLRQGLEGRFTATEQLDYTDPSPGG